MINPCRQTKPVPRRNTSRVAPSITPGLASRVPASTPAVSRSACGGSPRAACAPRRDGSRLQRGFPACRRRRGSIVTPPRHWRSYGTDPLPTSGCVTTAAGGPAHHLAEQRVGGIASLMLLLRQIGRVAELPLPPLRGDDHRLPVIIVWRCRLRCAGLLRARRRHSATRRVSDRAPNRWHGRSGSSRTIGCVFLPGVAGLLLGATRKRLAWPSAGGRR